MEISSTPHYRDPVRSAAVLWIVAVGAGGPAAQPASPSVAAEVAQAFAAGVDAYRLGRYDEAHRQLDRAASLAPTLPGPHRFLAAVASARERWPDCIAEARLAIELNPRSREISDTRRLHDRCRAQLGRPPSPARLGDGAAIAVIANVTGATVWIGGLRYGSTPVAPRRIKPGAHEIAIAKPGFRPVHRAVYALPGVVTDVVVELEPEQAAPAPRPGRRPTMTVQ